MPRIKGWKIKNTKEMRAWKGAVLYVSTPYEMMQILVAQLPNSRWNVDPDTIAFKARSFLTKQEALDFARAWMKKHSDVGE